MNRCTRFCKPLHNHSAIGPPKRVIVQHDPVVNLPFLSIDLRIFLLEKRLGMKCLNGLLIFDAEQSRHRMLRQEKGRAGISLVELVVAVALLSLVSVAAIQLMNMTQKTMIEPQTKLDQQLRSEAIASYI